jgi:OOP family OmpA-OmpF porin
MKRSSLSFLKLILAISLLLAFSSYSSAEPIYATKEPVEIYHPFYAGVLGGFIVPDDMHVDGGTDFELEDSWAAGAKAGYIFPFRWLAAELEYVHLGDHHIYEPSHTGRYRADNLMGNLVFRYPLGMIRPYIGGGIGWSRGDVEHELIDDTANNFGWQALAGINLEIIPSLSVDFGYRYFSSEYGIENIDATTRDHIISVGFNYHFGGKAPEPPPPSPPPPVKVKKCPDTPSCCTVDEEGCPTDSDKDGVCDGCDKCPDTPSCCVVDENGCPKDSDKDGVCDGCDKCPDTPAGVKVDKNGCPIPEIVEKGRTTLEVLFDFDKSTIKGNYSKDIDALADVMKKYEDLNVTIEGHTDNLNRSGKPNYNKKLSQRRADAVKKYLVEKSGINAKRLTAIGFGEEKPIASNETEEGRQKNRRVEAAVDYIIKK